ncbi:hypothetical protein [Ulvibacterium marinum]|uniref:hypothetical protein n=1 Tax=Ulvibacterium marinum TaxID=2419782 RepID=UPI001B877605|nr:hypothetical protein [Ulvibacterium marinum]
MATTFVARATDFTLFSNYSINDNNALSIATLAFFQKFRERENQIFDEVGVQPTLFWNINKTIALGPSLYYNSFGGFSERLSGIPLTHLPFSHLLGKTRFNCSLVDTTTIT